MNEYADTKETQTAHNLKVVDVPSFKELLEQPNDLSALDHHLLSTELVLSASPVGYFKKETQDPFAETSLQLPSCDIKTLASYSGENVAERLNYLEDPAVRAALLGYWMHLTDDSPDTQVVRTLIGSSLKPADCLSWKIKEKSDPNRSKLKFYVAKVALGTLDNASFGPPTVLVERHTYAATALDNDRAPRPGDIKAILGVEPRHDQDTRLVVATRTSTSFYAFKQQSADQ